jgi:hypothetical protein
MVDFRWCSKYDLFYSVRLPPSLWRTLREARKDGAVGSCSGVFLVTLGML